MAYIRVITRNGVYRVGLEIVNYELLKMFKRLRPLLSTVSEITSFNNLDLFNRKGLSFYHHIDSFCVNWQKMRDFEWEI